jgi:hypothetical protein
LGRGKAARCFRMRNKRLQNRHNSFLVNRIMISKIATLLFICRKSKTQTCAINPTLTYLIQAPYSFQRTL